MEKVTLRFLAVFFVLFLCFASVESQWGFGLGKGGGWDWLWSNMGQLDKYDLSQNRDKSGGVAIPKQQQAPGRTALRRRYGRFLKSIDDSSESSDSSSEEIAVVSGENVYGSYIENPQSDNFNDNNGQESQVVGAGETNNEGEEHVYESETGTGSDTQTGDNWNFNENSHNRQSGSDNSAWDWEGGNGGKREGSQYNAQDNQNNQGGTYDKRSLQTQPSQQGNMGNGRQQSQQGQHGGQGQSGQRRFRSWADYQRQQERNNLGEEYEAEDVTPTSKSNGGHGQSGTQGQGETEAEDIMPQSGNRSPVSTGSAYDAIEPEDRTTPAVVLNKKTTPEQEYEAEDVTTSAPGGSVTSGRVTYQRVTTEEYEMEGSKPSTSAPKVNKPKSDTWESGMNTGGSTTSQTRQGGRAPSPDSRGRWIDIGQMPHPRKENNAVPRNEWTAYASSVDGSSQGNGIQPRQSWVDENPNTKQSLQNQDQTKPGSATDQVNNEQTPSWRENNPGQQGSTDTWVGPDHETNQKPAQNAQVGSWLDTASNSQNNLPRQSMDSKPLYDQQQPKQEPLVRPADRSSSPVRPPFKNERNPVAIRPLFTNRFAKPTSPKGQKLPSLMPSPLTATNNQPPTHNRWRQQPLRPAQPSGRKQKQTAQKPSWASGSPNNVRQFPQDGWNIPTTTQNKKPQQPSKNTNTKPSHQPWNSNPNKNVPVRQHRKPTREKDSKRDPWNGKNFNTLNIQHKSPTNVIKEPKNDKPRVRQPIWKVLPVSPTLNIIDSTLPRQMPTNKGKNRPPAWSNPTSNLPSQNPIHRNNRPNEKMSGSIPNQRNQPVFKDINNVGPSKPGDSGKHMYPNDISRNPDINSPFSGDFVTEKPMVGGTKVSKRPDAGQVTVGLTLDVSDASVPNLQVNNLGNKLQRGDFVYQPKPAKVPQGHKPKGSRKTNWINTPHRDIETSTFSVINPNSPTSHTGPVIVRPTKNNRRPWNQDNILQPSVQQAPVKDTNEHLKQIKHLINKQHPSTVIKQFIEITTANTLSVSDTQGDNGLITNIDNTLSSDNPQVINLLRDIAQANQRLGAGHQLKGVPKNDVIAKMSSTAVLGNHHKTIDMAPGHGSIVDGVDAEVLLNSNANLHGIISSKNPGLPNPSATNSILDNQGSKNRTPYTEFRATGNKDAANVGELSMTVKRVNGEARPAENAELGQSKDVSLNQGSSKNVINIDKSSQATVSKTRGSSTSAGNPTYEASPPKAGSENNQNSGKNGVKTKLSTPSNTPGSVARKQNETTRNKGSRQSVSVTSEQTAPVAQRQFQTVSRAQRRRPGGGDSWRGAAGGGGGAWKVAARNEAREIVLEKEGHWNSLSHGTRDQKVARSNTGHHSG